MQSRKGQRQATIGAAVTQEVYDALARAADRRITTMSRLNAEIVSRWLRRNGYLAEEHHGTQSE